MTPVAAVMKKELIGQLIDSAERLHPRAYSRAHVQKVNVTNVSQIKEPRAASWHSAAQATSSTTSATPCSPTSSAREGPQPRRRQLSSRLRSTSAAAPIDIQPRQSSPRCSRMPSSAAVPITEVVLDNRYKTKWLEYMTIAFIVHLRRSELPPRSTPHSAR